MKCLIDTIIEKFYTRGDTVESIRNYLHERYNIYLDKASLMERLKQMNLIPENKKLPV